nr:ATP-binding cassette domain-containing protein [Hymenobacter sp. PAMC 26628]
MNDALTYSEGFFDILDAADATEPTGALLPDHLRGTFALRHVDFTYPSGTQALHDVSLTIEAGKTTALVGLSGAGKSTVINLLCKFYAPDRGALLPDGSPWPTTTPTPYASKSAWCSRKTTFSRAPSKRISATA